MWPFLKNLVLLAWGFALGWSCALIWFHHRRRHGIVGIRIVKEQAMGTVNEGTPFKFRVTGIRQDGSEGPVPAGLDMKLSDPTLGSVAFQPDGSQGAVVFVAEGTCKLTADAGGFHDEIDLTFVKAPPVESPVVAIKIVPTP